MYKGAYRVDCDGDILEHRENEDKMTVQRLLLQSKHQEMDQSDWKWEKKIHASDFVGIKERELKNNQDYEVGFSEPEVKKKWWPE